MDKKEILFPGRSRNIAIYCDCKKRKNLMLATIGLITVDLFVHAAKKILCVLTVTYKALNTNTTEKTFVRNKSTMSVYSYIKYEWKLLFIPVK